MSTGMEVSRCRARCDGGQRMSSPLSSSISINPDPLLGVGIVSFVIFVLSVVDELWSEMIQWS